MGEGDGAMRRHLEDTLALGEELGLREADGRDALATAEALDVHEAVVLAAVDAAELIRKEEEQADPVQEAAMLSGGPEAEQCGDKVVTRASHDQLRRRVPLQLLATRTQHEAAIAEDSAVAAEVAKGPAGGLIRELDLCLREIVARHWQAEATEAFESTHCRHVGLELRQLVRASRRIDSLVEVACGDEDPIGTGAPTTETEGEPDD